MSVTDHPSPPPVVLRRSAAAAHVGLSLATLNRLAVTGGGPLMTELSPGCVGYMVADLDAWLASRPKRRSTSDRTMVAA